MNTLKNNMFQLSIACIAFAFLFTITNRADAYVSDGSVMLDDVVIHYKIVDNTGGNGSPLFLLHGGFGSIDSWYNSIEAFSENYKVIAVDSRGHGESTYPIASISYSLITTDLLHLMRYLGYRPLLGDKVNLVGWSDGAVVALNFCLLYPNGVNKAVFFGVNVSVYGLRVAVQSSLNFPNMFNYLRDTEKWTNNVEWQRYRNDMLDMWGADSYLDSTYSDPFLALNTINFNLDGTEKNEEDKIKTYVLAAGSDATIRVVHMQNIADNINGCEFEVVEGMFHGAPTQEISENPEFNIDGKEQADVFNEKVLKFLKK